MKPSIIRIIKDCVIIILFATGAIMSGCENTNDRPGTNQFTWMIR